MRTKAKRQRFGVSLLVLLLSAVCGIGALHALPVEARAASSAFTVTTSSDIKSEDGSYHPSYLYDGNLGTSWLAAWQNEGSPECDEWVVLDFGEVIKVDSITLYRHYDGTIFPVDFTIDWSVRGQAYETVAGFSMEGYTLSDGDFSGENFRIRTVARYIRVHVTKRSTNPDGYYLLGISEIEAETSEATAAEIAEAERKDAAFVHKPVVDDAVIPSTATASSYNNAKDPDTGAPMWSISHINDGETATQWCADWGSGVDTESCDEWIVLTFASPQYVTGMTIVSQVIGHYGFPKSFSFAWTLDGENYFPVSGARYEDESTENLRHVKTFETPRVATAIRMQITSSYPDTMHNYVPQLAELQAHGRAATEEEVTAATAEFTRLMGQAQAAKPKTRTRGYESQMTAFLVVAIAALGGAVALAVCNLTLGRKKKSVSAKEDAHA